MGSRGPDADSRLDPNRDERLNALNHARKALLETCGERFVSNAAIDGRYLLRACIVNFRTSAADVAAIPGIVRNYGREVVEAAPCTAAM